ncbi:MAG TPA: hypothetical protein VFF69_04490, partial [Phycisphaerales bacterium]|nr:hypothetical protein [Phycisphaerales bacterium]
MPLAALAWIGAAWIQTRYERDAARFVSSAWIVSDGDSLRLANTDERAARAWAVEYTLGFELRPA